MARAGFLLLPLTAAWFPLALLAQEPLPVTRLTGTVQLDGRSDEPAWQGVEPVPVIMFQPVHGGAPSERTEIRFAYDENAFYASARLYDSDATGIRATTLKRDVLDWANDYFCFSLDTFHDRENALGFCTTPAGIRLDYTLQHDGSGPSNRNWNGFWDVAVARDETGWFAEIRVPWTTLRFQPEGDRVQMGLTTFRLIARKAELSIFPAVPTRWGLGGVNKPSQAHPIVLEGVRSRRPLYVAPYALGGVGQTYALNAAQTVYERRSEPAREVGLDLKLGLTSNMTLDLTANTDFAQAEADDQQVNLTRFSLFFPEKRQFFQERSSNFDFVTGMQERVFHSRRVGLVEGEPVRIYGGGRLVGRLGDWDVALLDMQTAPGGSAPSENQGVFRLRRRVLNESSYAGGIVTSRIGTDGSYNVAYGADAIFRVAPNDYLTLQWVQTLDDGEADAFRRLRTGFARVRWEGRAVEGLGYSAGAAWVGPEHNPGLGFIQRTGVLRLGGNVGYGRRAPDVSPVLRQVWSMRSYAILRSEDRSMETWSVAPTWKLEMKSRAQLELSASATADRLDREFRLSESAVVPAGEYTFHDAELKVTTPDAYPLRGTVELQAGSFYDGRRYVATLGPTWNLSRHFELEATYQYNDVEFAYRGQSLRAHVGRLRALTMLSTRVSAATFVQYNSAIDAIIANARVRYNPREGNDLYLVYNHGMHTDRERLDPALPLTDSRTLLVKYTRTLDFGF